MLRADVRREDGRPDDEPAKVPAREEVVGGRILTAADHPPGDPEQHCEIQSDENPIEAGHMRDPISRREWLMAMGAVSAGAMVPVSRTTRLASPILPLTSTSEVFIPPRGRAFQKFSFDFPEPSVEFGGLRFGFLVFSRENAYGLDASRMTAVATPGGLEVTASGLVWAGGQERAPGTLVARLRQEGDAVLWDITAEMDRPIK